MNLIFIIKNRDKTPFMVVRTTPSGSTFEPMSKQAKELVGILRREYGKTPITKPELIQSMDSSKIIEGPSPSGTASQKKVANLSLVGEELRKLPVVSISEVLLSEFSTEEFKNVLTFKASSFISDQTRASAHFEIKGVRAIWDPSLSIPGTNRRGGFRCPVGTRYGGQITDRFGRSCGWGIARRIANQIADIGERLEERDDGKRKRRIDRRNARMIRRLGGSVGEGRVEGGLRNIAERLGGETPSSSTAPPRRESGRVGLMDEMFEDVDPRTALGRIVNRDGRRRRRRAEPESDTPSVREPRSRRREVIPETAPTPKPKPRPARRPAPAGKSPRARPRVAPQPENVDVLTARDASDAGETEDFKPYVLRKYNEYAKRVREIRLAGGDAGMLTRREWYTINKDNLRDAWKDAHGRSAPSDFEPPTPRPRRPRNNRRRRRQATAEGAGRSATRRPTPDDVPEPPPARPVRPARPRRPSRPRPNPNAGRGFVTPGDAEPPAPRPQVPAAPRVPAAPPSGISDDFPSAPEPSMTSTIALSSKWTKREDGKWERNGHTFEIVRRNGEIRSFVFTKPDGDELRHMHQPSLFSDVAAIADSLYDQFGITQPPLRPIRRRNRGRQNPVDVGRNPYGNLPISREDAPLGRFEDNSDKSIDTEQKAVEFVKNGGDIGKVPAQFLFMALLLNSSKTKTDRNKRFQAISPNGGAIGFTQLFFMRGANGKPTNQGWCMKAAAQNDNIGELVGWNFLATLGIIEDGAIADGLVPAPTPEIIARMSARNQARLRGLSGRQFVITPLAFNGVSPDHLEISGNGARGEDFVLRDLIALPDRALPERFNNLLANYALGVGDRHAGNGMGRVVTEADGTKRALVVPMDLGWAGRQGGSFQNYSLGMDEGLRRNASQELQRIGDVELRKETYRRILTNYEKTIEKIAEITSGGKEKFIEDAHKNMTVDARTTAAAERIYAHMQVALTNLRAERPYFVDLLPVGER